VDSGQLVAAQRSADVSAIRRPAICAGTGYREACPFGPGRIGRAALPAKSSPPFCGSTHRAGLAHLGAALLGSPGQADPLPCHIPGPASLRSSRPLPPLYVIPTKMGIQLFFPWIPAYAGMTLWPLTRLRFAQAGLSRKGRGKLLASAKLCLGNKALRVTGNSLCRSPCSITRYSKPTWTNEASDGWVSVVGRNWQELGICPPRNSRIPSFELVTLSKKQNIRENGKTRVQGTVYPMPWAAS